MPNSTEHALNLLSASQKNALLERRSSQLMKFNIAAANPLLAEKLSTPTSASQLNGFNGRPDVAPLVPKIEKGKSYNNDVSGFKRPAPECSNTLNTGKPIMTKNRYLDFYIHRLNIGNTLDTGNAYAVSTIITRNRYIFFLSTA